VRSRAEDVPAAKPVKFRHEVFVDVTHESWVVWANVGVEPERDLGRYTAQTGRLLDEVSAVERGVQGFQLGEGGHCQVGIPNDLVDGALVFRISQIQSRNPTS
jgi:hypothetical protein